MTVRSPSPRGLLREKAHLGEGLFQLGESGDGGMWSYHPLCPAQGDFEEQEGGQEKLSAVPYFLQARMQALVLLLCTGVLLGYGSCQDTPNGPEEVSGVRQERWECGRQCGQLDHTHGQPLVFLYI